MNNLSYIVVIFLFAGMVWVGVDKREGIKQAAIDKAQAIEDEKNARIAADNAAEAARLADLDKFIREISHDGDTATDLFDVKLQAISADVENDKMTYKWEQVPVSDDYVGGPEVKLSSNNKPTTYFQARAGEYRFELTVTDAYGDSTVDSQVIKINPEPNTAPSADIKVENLPQPKDPFDGDAAKIKEFQTKNGLEPDGKWGPATKEVWEKSKEESTEEAPVSN